MVCPMCGIIATNPFALKGLAAKAVAIGRTLPFGETIATAAEQLGVISPQSSPRRDGVAAATRHDGYSTDKRVHDALAR